MSIDDSVLWSNMISVTEIRGPAHALSLHGFIEMILRMLGRTRKYDELTAFKYLGGLGYSANRRARRERLLREAEEIAGRVGHGDEDEPMRIEPDFVLVPVSCASDARKMFGSGEST